MYPPKSYKWDPVTGAIAIRTQLPEEGDFASMAWLVGTHNLGAKNKSSAEVADWIDIPAELLATLIPITESED